MSILRNQRYNQFETGMARDAFRGLPLQQFPWVLERHELRSAQGELVWVVEISCLEASPSGFGAKLNFKLQGKARLSRASVGRHLHESASESRVNLLFSHDLFEVEDECFSTGEGTLEELPKFGRDLLKAFQAQLNETWSTEAIKSQLRLHLRQTSPGGFGERPA